ncbi:hypothetical protein HRI_004595200 [Hibiscus trionum]|uniref:Endonuclease/exonuclease/phosphatase domain-containing protein n=1 Tax=Hibiscus trionum TaxID=183268 RepID=A0A9W7J759_HIBTR|nr:hypothetical protein HRI_004595200 [Hibiscus trionum]
MNFSLFSWNIRGLGRAEKVQAVRREISLNNLKLVFIQETKKADFYVSTFRELWNKLGIGKIFSPSIGSAEGLLCMWGEDFLEVSVNSISQRFVALIGNVKEDNFRCIFINVYRPSEDSERSSFMAELLQFWRIIQLYGVWG